MNAPKIGDRRKCEKCGEDKATYKQIAGDRRTAQDASSERQQPGDRFAWSCDACGFEDRVPS